MKRTAIIVALGTAVACGVLVLPVVVGFIFALVARLLCVGVDLAFKVLP